MEHLELHEIWIGNYNSGHIEESFEPKLLDRVWAVDFKTACFKYELHSKLERILQGEVLRNLNQQDYNWFFNPHTISNSWTGKYYESKEEALKSFIPLSEQLDIFFEKNPNATCAQIDGTWIPKSEWKALKSFK